MKCSSQTGRRWELLEHLLACQIYHTDGFLLPRGGPQHPLLKRTLWTGGAAPGFTYYQRLKPFVKCVLVTSKAWEEAGRCPGTGVPLHTLMITKLNQMESVWAVVEPVLRQLPGVLVQALTDQRQRQDAARGMFNIQNCHAEIQQGIVGSCGNGGCWPTRA